jgi:hypothetical protein
MIPDLWRVREDWPRRWGLVLALLSACAGAALAVLVPIQ